MNTDEYMPKIEPQVIAMVKPRMDSPPKNTSGNNARRMVNCVSEVRTIVWLIDRSISAGRLIFLYFRRFSRIRSEITTVSLRLRPTSVGTAAIDDVVDSR